MDNNKPLASFCLVTYNQEKFVLDALKGAVCQTYDNLEIIVSDDCSQDRTFDIIQDFVSKYEGPHKFVLNRNEYNLGIAKHVNKVLYELSKGEIILLAAGDDVSLPKRTQVSVDFMLRHPEVSSLSFASEECDANLQPKVNTFRENITPNHDSIMTLEDYVYFSDFILFPGDSRVLRRSVLDTFPPLKYTKAEDMALFFRSILIGSVGYIRQPLVKYRIYGGNVTCKKEVDVEVVSQDRLNMYKQFKEDVNIAVQKGYIGEHNIPLINKKVETLLNYLYGYIAPTPKHSKAYCLVKNIARKIASMILD